MKKCTAHGLAMMSFIFAPLLGGQICATRSYQGEPFYETWLKSVLGLHSMNAIIGHLSDVRQIWFHDDE